MKARLVILACLVTLLSSVAHALDNKFDIILQGPWILYQYHNANLNKDTPVLIAIAPRVNTIYHAPILSTGDGYTVWDGGIFCLTFGQECATITGAKSLVPSPGYAKPNLLPVYFKNATAAQTDWDLVSVSHTQSLFAFILPMPNGYSNESIWNMQFSSKFGQGYKGDAGRSIGLQLHYDAGPVYFDLKKCTDLTTNDCNNSVPLKNRTTTLANTGTLELIMKAPDSDDICDYHVRSLHHPMLHLLDGAKLKDGQNINQDYGYVDPARSVDINGKGYYSDVPPNVSCYLKDAQQNDEPLLGGAVIAANKMHKTLLTVAAMLKEGTIDINPIENLLRDLHIDAALIKEIDDEGKILNKESGFPRLSDLSRFAELLHLAADAAEKKNGGHSAAIKLRELASDVQTKNGADCRTAIMLVQPAVQQP